MNEKIVSIQVLRFVAAAAVVATHAERAGYMLGDHPLPPWTPAQIGGAGVDVFFVISGFVIARMGPLAEPRPSGCAFFLRRLSRVAPLYFALSLPIALADLASAQPHWDKFIATFLFWPAAGGEIVTPYSVFGWTLCFEMLFYSAVALTLAGGRLRRNLAIAGAAFVGFAALEAATGLNGLRIVANPIFAEFGFGAVLAIAWPWLRRRDWRLGLALAALAAGAFAIEASLGVGDLGDWAPTLRDTEAAARVLVLGLPAMALVAGALICEDRLQGRGWAALAWLGGASYAIYINELGAIRLSLWLCSWMSGPARFWLTMPVTAAICVGSGILIFLYLERPLLGLIRGARPALSRARLAVPAMDIRVGT